MVASVTPILGFNDTMSDLQPYWDNGRTHPTTGVPLVSPAVGTAVLATDGHTYVWAKASAAVAAAGTVVILTETGTPPVMTYATGAGAFTTVAANAAIGDYSWIKRTLL